MKEAPATVEITITLKNLRPRAPPTAPHPADVVNRGELHDHGLRFPAKASSRYSCGMREEFRIISSYVVAVLRQWWVVVVEILLVLTDVFERIFGTWLLPSTRIKFGIGFAALVVAQYRAYREVVVRSIGLKNEKAALRVRKQHCRISSSRKPSESGVRRLRLSQNLSKIT